MFRVYRQMKALGILGMNARNADYIMPHNPRQQYPLVDNKLLTKQLALSHQIAVPALYHKIEREHEIADLAQHLNPYDDFVIKPAHGSGGDGILVIIGRRKSGYVQVNGEMLLPEDLNHHVSNILSGMYSLGGQTDTALIEYRVKFDPIFSAISFQGVPDIRMIVYQGYPVMGMLRLPTRQSHGKANLHQGAVGVGLDIATGRTLTSTWQNKVIDYHPDTGQDIAGLSLPYWPEILQISANCYELAGLGYLGVDLVLDEQRGPLMLELNARPGLSIQIANQAGLQSRLQHIDKYKDSSHTRQDRITLAQNSFKAS